jgi:hypothetical protein
LKGNFAFPFGVSCLLAAEALIGGNRGQAPSIYGNFDVEHMWRYGEIDVFLFNHCLIVSLVVFSRHVQTHGLFLVSPLFGCLTFKIFETQRMSLPTAAPLELLVVSLSRCMLGTHGDPVEIWFWDFEGLFVERIAIGYWIGAFQNCWTERNPSNTYRWRNMMQWDSLQSNKWICSGRRP